MGHFQQLGVTRMNSKAYLTALRVRQRYGITAMTLWRWQRNDALQFPQPIVINKRLYWDISDLESWDASRQRAA
jgi:predicted DNA-binding transcriptional regulator AlpA